LGSLFLEGSAAAQPPVPPVRSALTEFDFESLNLDTSLARPRFAVEHADRGGLARERAEAARTVVRARFQEYLAGRGTTDLLLEAIERVVEAEVAAKGEAGRGAALEVAWRQLCLIEMVQRSRHEAGRVGTADYLDARI